MNNFKEFVASYLTQENITFFLAFFGAVGALFQSIYQFRSTRKKVVLQIFDSAVFSKNIIQFFMNIQNQSNAPICITSISICYNKNEIFCELVPKLILGAEGEYFRTPMFPLNFSPLQGGAYFFEFINCPKISLDPGKTLDFVIYTNRGPIKKSVILDERSHYLHIE